MAWFGGNLKNLTGNLTGQLSNVATSAASFTRDVIAEGTEEVADRSTELQIAQEKVQRLESAVVGLKAENERLRTINTELDEKAESSELQINSISSQYRSLLVEKEDQLKSLIQKQHEMQDLHQSMMSSTHDHPALTAATSTSSLSGSAIMTDGLDFGSAMMGDGHDFDDVIASQQEINRLSNEVGRLRAECSHWKELASGQGGTKPVFHIGEDAPPSDETAELKAKIKTLEEKLRREVDESQHELSALQDSHSHKLKTMSKKHKAEVDDYQRRLESLEKMVGLGAPSSPSSSAVDCEDGSGLQQKVLELERILREMRRQVAELEEANHQLEKENGRLVEAERDSTRLVQTLKRKMDALEERSGQEVKSQAEADVANLKKERDELREEVEHLMKVVNRQETELEQILGSHEQVRAELYATKQRLLTELNASHASTSAMLEDIHDARRKFSTEEALRRSRLLREKQDIVNKMMEAGQKITDSKSVVTTLEAASVDIADQAAEIVSDMGCQKHQDITADFVSSLERENDLLKHHMSRLQSEIDDLNQSYESLAEDKKQCEELIVSLTQKVNKLSGDDPAGLSASDSELTPNVTGESDGDAPHGGSTPVRQHITYRRPHSPSDSSVASEAGSSMREGWTSETELSSDGGLLMESKRSQPDDVVSFDGEFDDSIMFNGIKERFPEAADAFREQLTQFEMVRADWEMEKQALEEVVVRMREQLKEKDRIIQDMTAEKGLMSVHNENIEDLEERLKSLEQINADMVGDKEAAELRISEMTERLQMMEKEKEDGNVLVVSLQKEKDELQDRLSQLETESSAIKQNLMASQEREDSELKQLREEKGRLEHDLQQLDAEHQAAMDQIILSRDNLMQEIKNKDIQIQQRDAEHQAAVDQIISSRDNLLQEIKEKDGEIQEAKDRAAQVGSELDTAIKDRLELESELDSLREDLSTSRADLLDSEQMKQEQSVAMTTLRTKLQSMQDEYNELLKTYDELKKTSENSSFRDEMRETGLVTGNPDGAENLDNLQSREELQAKVDDLTARLEAFESKEKDPRHPEESMAYLEHELSRTHHEIDELNKSIDEREIKLQELLRGEQEHQQVLKQRDSEIEAVKAENVGLQRDIDVVRIENDGLQREVASRDAKINELQGGSQDVLRDVNSGIGERDQAGQLQQSLLDDMERTCKELKADLLAKEVLLESTNNSKAEIEELVAQKEEDIRALAEENAHFLKNVEDSKARMSELYAKVKHLESIQQEFEQREKDVDHLQCELQDANEMLSQKSSKEQEYLREINQMEESIGHLQDELQQKDSMLAKETANKQQDLNGAEDEKDSQEKTEWKLKERLKSSEELVEQLQSQVSNKEIELGTLNDELNIARHELSAREDKLSEISNILADRDKERDHLQSEIDKLHDKLKQSNENLAAVEQLEKELELRSSVISELQQEVDSSRDLGAQVSALNETLHEKDSEIDQLNQSLVEFVQEKQHTEKTLFDYGNQIEDLQRTNQEKEEDIRRLREEVHNITTQLQQPSEQSLPNSEMHNNLSGNIDDVLTPSSPFGKSSSGVLQGQDGAISDNEKHYEKVIQERDKEIGMLQQERQSLLTSLNEKSASTMGNSVLVDLHKNQMKVKTLESERHQMMTVLNEKTREASNLKNEVHKLLKVISAQKTALEKAQDDIRDLQNGAKGSRDDMQKEALQNLSRLIQDKDLEIQALKQKNTSLLEVLQAEAPSNSSQISDVLAESEKLQKENAVLKEEKDQLIVSIHQKHQESLAYYEEVQRLVGVINSEMQKYGALEKQHQELQSEVEVLTESMNQSQIEQQEACKEKESMTEELLEKQRLVAELQSQLSELDTARTNLVIQVKELEQSCLRKDEEVSEKDSHISDLKERIENLNEQRENLVPVESAVKEMVIRPETVQLQEAAPAMNYQQFLEEKDAEIAELRTKLQSVEAHSQASDELLKSKEELLKSKEELLKSKDQAKGAEKIKEQLESQGHALLEMDALVQDRSMELERKKMEVATLKQHVDRQDQIILERDTTLQKLSHDSQRLQQELQAKTEEAHTLRQHTQQLVTRLQAVEAELAKSLQEITSQQHLVHNKDGELRQLQDLLARTGAEIREKDFEIGALQDKCKTLTRLVDEKETDSQGEVRRLLREAEAMQTQAQRFQSERDQTLLALEKCQRDLCLLQQEVDTRATNEQKLMSDLDRLRNHLIQMEDAYTQEALQAEEREKGLRNRLSIAEEQAHSSSSAIQSASKEAMAQMETLRDQLAAATEQKDQALMQLTMVQEESQEYILSLSNLQLVLEQFQQEKEASIAAEVEVYEIKAREKERIAADLHKKNVELEERLTSAQEALDVASRLSEQLDKKEEALERLKSEMHKKDEALEEFHRRFEEVSSNTESKVDKWDCPGSWTALASGLVTTD